MKVSTKFPVGIVRATVALTAVAAVALGASSLPASAATKIANSGFNDIAAGATRVVVQVNRGLNAKTDRDSTYTATNKTTITALIAHVNELPKAPPTGEMCPMDVGAKLTLSFYRHAAKPYAIVVADPGGCGPVSIRDFSANDTLKGSAAVGGGVSFSAYVATNLHIKTLQVL
jgi:hypothetical protein